jgi:hypothetical protein
MRTVPLDCLCHPSSEASSPLVECDSFVLNVRTRENAEQSTSYLDIECRISLSSVTGRFLRSKEVNGCLLTRLLAERETIALQGVESRPYDGLAPANHAWPYSDLPRRLTTDWKDDQVAAS